MDQEILKGKWLRAKDDVRTRWGRLTEDEVDQIQGDAERLVGKLQEHYGYPRDQAELELNEFLRMSDEQRKGRVMSYKGRAFLHGRRATYFWRQPCRRIASCEEEEVRNEDHRVPEKRS
jgi:uncharacterized protein YjbJ (UPF0337 family)